MHQTIKWKLQHDTRSLIASKLTLKITIKNFRIFVQLKRINSFTLVKLYIKQTITTIVCFFPFFCIFNVVVTRLLRIFSTFLSLRLHYLYN